MHTVVRLAKETVEEYIRNRRVKEPPSETDELLKGRAGVFVCLKKNGELRGCIGTIEPQCSSVAEETIKNAISAATHDPRFPPVSEDELDALSYSVDILTAPERVEYISELDSKRFGVIVTKDVRRGLLLPDLEGVDTVEDQIRIAKMKAGIGLEEEDIIIERFEVKRFK